uniref:SOCS box domain-containing protein n=1 Tax=Ditylenchus dipsaci TaxID=166011 RepID=A0A915EGD4_9BILA
MVSFRNIKWLDGVGDFDEDEVYSNDQLPSYYFTSGDLELCLSPSGRFLFVHLRDQEYVTSQLNSDVSIQTVSSVVVYLDKFPEQRTLRQRVISINHREHEADFVGHRVFRLNESRFAFARFIERFDYGPDYCAISNEQGGQILRFSKNPVLSGAFAVSTSRHPFFGRPTLFSAEAPDDLFFPFLGDASRLRNFAAAESSDNPNSWPNTAFHRYSFSSQELSMQSAAPCYRTGFPVFFEANATSSQRLGRQRGSRMTPTEVTLYPASSSALRTMLFFSRLVTASTLYWTSMRWIFEPLFAFSFTLYFRLLLSYTLSSVREELHKCVRKLFPSYTISSGILDTSEWRWISTFNIPGSLSSKIISESSLEQVSYNCIWRTKCVSILSRPVMNNKCISLRRIVEMKLQRFPNIALKEAGKKLIRYYDRC